MPVPPTAQSRIGSTIDGRYRLDAVLGTGGFGAVYRARHLQLDHDVAVKLLHEGADASTAKRLTREAKVLARLDHPNCVRIMDFGHEGGGAYLVMELVEGRPLSQALGEPWAPRRAVDMALQLLAGLEHAHALGLVHRDLKPANVLLAASPGGGSTVRVIDFGIVAIAAGEQLGSFTEQLTATGAIIGTPRYMSPEQLLGAKVDARSDLYAFGLVLYEMLTGQPAFEAGNVRVLAYLHAVAPTPLLPDEVPDELAALVGQLLAKKPEQRPPTAADVRQRLLALRPSLPDAPPRATAGPREAASAEPLGAEPLEELSVGPRVSVGRFSLLRELGRGAMGVVYLGWDETLDRQVAVKLLRPSPSHIHASERMLREARGLARVAHPNVVAVYELGSHQGQLFVAMEHIRGRTLRAWQDDQPRSWSDTLARLIEAGRGLAAVHAAGLVHRDFKPENVLVGDDEHAHVVDFGLVRAASPAFDMVDRLAPGIDEPKREAGAPPPPDVDPLRAKLTRTGAIIGTPAYMALEQLAGLEVDARSDQFAFCVVAYEALYGQRPFVGRSLEDLAAKLAAGHLQPRPKDSAVPRRVDEALARGLQVVPSSRWDGMDALLDALERAAGLRGGGSARRWIAGVGGLVLLAGATWALVPGAEAVQAEPTADTIEPTPDEPSRMVPALERTQALLARARPDHAESWRDAIELGARHRDAMTPEIRASLHAVAGAMHESWSLRDLGEADAQTWSPAGPVLALARRNGGIALWDADARAPMRALEHATSLGSPRFSADGELLVAREGDRRAVLWHVSTGTELGELEQPGLRQAVFATDTQQLLIASDEGVSRWGLVRGRELERMAVLGDDSTVVGLASVDERVLLLSSRGRVSQWTTASEPLVQLPLQGFEERADQVLVLAPDATRVARTSTTGLELWDTGTGTRIATRIPEPAKIVRVEFSDDSRTLAVMLRGRAPLLLDATTGEPRATMPTRAEVPAVAFDPIEDQLLALGDDGALERVALGSGRTTDHFVGLAPGTRSLAIDATGSRLSAIGADGIASVWAIDSVAIARRAPAGRDVDGETAKPLASLEDWRGPTIDAEGRVRAHSGEVIAVLEVEGPVTAVALSPDASTIATASGTWPARVELWTREGQRTRTLEVAGQEPRALAFSADGARLACAGVGPRVEIRSVADGTSVIELRTTEAEIGTISFAPDGTRLAVGGREVHLWQLDTGFDLATLATARGSVAALGFLPDGRQVGIAYEDGARVLRWVDEEVLLAELCRVGAAAVDAGTCDPVLGHTQQ